VESALIRGYGFESDTEARREVNHMKQRDSHKEKRINQDEDLMRAYWSKIDRVHSFYANYAACLVTAMRP
jgi:hypothetical protein